MLSLLRPVRLLVGCGVPIAATVLIGTRQTVTRRVGAVAVEIAAGTGTAIVIRPLPERGLRVAA